MDWGLSEDGDGLCGLRKTEREWCVSTYDQDSTVRARTKKQQGTTANLWLQKPSCVI